MQENASDADIQAWYDQHKADYTQPQRDRYSVIQTKTEADADAILAQLKGGADFAELAKPNPLTRSLPVKAAIWAGLSRQRRQTS